MAILICRILYAACTRKGHTKAACAIATNLGSPGYYRTLSREGNVGTIQRSPIRALLPAIGFNRNMPLEVVVGPTSIGDIGLRYLYVEQGYQKTSALLQHSRPGKMMWTVIQGIQVTAGVGFAVLAELWRFLSHAVGQ
jgi:hypothetical protein